MKKILTAAAAIALLSGAAMLPGTARADSQIGCDVTKNTQHPPTQPAGNAIDTDRRAPCEKIEGMNANGMSGSGSPNVGSTGPAASTPQSTQGGGAGQSQ
jgi:hypothetical protein